MSGSRSSRLLPFFETLAAVALLAAISAGATWWFCHQGYLLYSGDALAHLNIARRIVDSRTPGMAQIGTVWLPLPHLLMLPFVGNDELWRSGLAGAIPSSICFVVAGGFLFAAVRRLFQSTAVAFVALFVFAINPNVLYLQSTAMSEPVFFAGFFALLYFAVLFRQSQSIWAGGGAAVASLVSSLSRYEGWFLIPFLTVYFLVAARRRRLLVAFLFGAVASLGPLYWLGHNWWFHGDVLEFYHGPWSAKGIYQRALDAGMQRYTGDGEWGNALLYFCHAARLCAGLPLLLLGVGGVAASVMKRNLWPLALPALLPIFYVWSIHSGGTPIFVPDLWPNSYYNTRYGLAALPLLVVAAGALIGATPGRFRLPAAVGTAVLAAAPWIWAPAPESWICWRESQVNSEHRRAWTREAADFLRARYRGGGVMTSFGDLSGTILEAGLPLRETLHSGNAPHWQASIARPDLFLREEWALTFSGDEVATAILRAQRSGPRYDCVKRIALKGAPVVEIYKRIP